MKLLEESGIISKGKDDVKKSRIKYSLTEKGIDLLPVMVDIIVWSGCHDEMTEADKAFLVQARESRGSLLSSTKEKLEKAHLS